MFLKNSISLNCIRKNERLLGAIIYLCLDMLHLRQKKIEKINFPGKRKAFKNHL